MTKFHLFSQDSVRLETAPTGEVRKSRAFQFSELSLNEVNCEFRCVSELP